MKRIIFFITLIFIAPKEAHAYLDPGNGSYIFQLILGLVLGVLFSIKVFWKKIRIFLQHIFNHCPKNKKQS